MSLQQKQPDNRPITRSLVELFTSPTGQVNWLLVLLFAAINGIVIYNTQKHQYNVAYDVNEHLTYATRLSEGRLPTPDESKEFFSPPLAYVPTAMIRALGAEEETAFKKGKELQAIYSIVLTLFLLRLCLHISPDPRLRIWTLFILGSIPAYYRSFVMIRGEALLAMLAVIAMWLAVSTFATNDNKPSPGWRRAALLGLVLGLAALTRQWAILLLPAVGLLGLYCAAVDRDSRRRVLAQLAITATVCALVGAPFYFSLRHRYGSMTAFNRTPTTAPLPARHPAAFYLDFPLRTMLSEPVKHKLAGRLIPIFYSDLWGDYWCYYVVYGRTAGGAFRGGMRESRTRANIIESNYATMAPYLGRQNAVAIVPTLALLCGCVVSVGAMFKAMINAIRRRTSPCKPEIVTAFLGLCVACSFAGYLGFVVTFPNDIGDTIKAIYMLQAYPPLAVLSGIALVRLQNRWPRASWVVVVLLMAAFAHGANAFFTRYI